MARKSARAIAAAEAANGSHTSDVEGDSSKVPLSDLAPKSCLTCGRVITPRAKWAKDWAGIKYCSDRCRTTRPGRVVVRFTSEGDSAALDTHAGVKKDRNNGEVSVDLETFVEGVLLEVAGRRGATLEDAQERIKELLRSASIPVEADRQRKDASSFTGSDSEDKEQASDSALHPLWRALDSPPGFRERVRRAARRLALGLTHDSDAKQTSIITTDRGSLELTQAGKVLQTVQDLSFAKGVIHIRLKQ
ncbi:uncharacterized protein UTRI_01936_B [Ustilago trichophora]|uniref:Uncharacterized protein n=1 Tax=Ustilago trichophora TaxID=86804 RepID=A0A5C3DWD1_9BASI|nr:uncharacterized protein UTRI_01936_B [Ustilago trichophora]